MEMKKNKRENRRYINIYHNLLNDTWEAKYYEVTDDGNGRNLVDDAPTTDTVLAACKAYAVIDALESPHVVETMGGIFRKNGSGFSFLTNTRDFSFEKVSYDEAERVKYGPKPGLWKRLKTRIRTWHWILLSWWMRIRHRDITIKAADINITLDEETPSASNS